MMATTTPERVDKELNKQSFTQNNPFLPVFRLPPEILEDVFARVRDCYESYSKPTFRVPHWVNLSYVCHHWRNVALNCSTLWTYHFTVSLRWTDELLARSKQASLKIRIRYDVDRDMPWWSLLLEKVLRHAERIQELRLTIPDTTLLPTVSLYAPRLQILELFSCLHLERTLTINNGDILPLRILRLASFPLPWYSFNLSRVTTLFLSYDSPSQQNIMEFFTTLSRMQALTDLYLEYSLPTARGLLSDGAFNISLKVSLPCLVCLSVEAPLPAVVALLSCITIPLETRLCLAINDPADIFSINDYAQILPFLAARVSHSEDLSSSCPTIRSLAICYRWYESTLAISPSERDDYDPEMPEGHLPRDCDIPLVVRVGLMEQPLALDDRIMSDICCCIPSTHVQSLHIINPPSSRYFWRKMLGHLDGLRRLKLSDGSMPNLASLLALTGDDPLGHTFVPALEELELHLMTFRCKGRKAEKTLVDALSTRKALQLIMTQCTDVK